MAVVTYYEIKVKINKKRLAFVRTYVILYVHTNLKEVCYEINNVHTNRKEA